MDRLLTPDEAGRLLGVTADWIRRRVNDGDLPHVQLTGKGGRIRISEHDLDQFVQSRTVPARDRSNPTLARIRERSRQQAS